MQKIRFHFICMCLAQNKQYCCDIICLLLFFLGISRQFFLPWKKTAQLCLRRTFRYWCSKEITNDCKMPMLYTFFTKNLFPLWKKSRYLFIDFKFCVYNLQLTKSGLNGQQKYFVRTVFLIFSRQFFPPWKNPDSPV